VHYPLNSRCCGGSQKGTIPEVGLDLIHYLLSEAQANGAEVISTVCPLCQFNLDSFQKESGDRHHPIFIPVVYFTQLLALALGAPAREIGLHRGLVPIEAVFAQKEIAYA